MTPTICVWARAAVHLPLPRSYVWYKMLLLAIKPCLKFGEQNTKISDPIVNLAINNVGTKQVSYKKFELMLTRRAKAYSSSGSVV